MGNGYRAGAQLQQELLRLLRPLHRRLGEQLSERVRPRLAEIGRTHAGRPAPEILAALDEAVRAAGGTPDRRALEEFADDIAQGRNPFL